MNESKGQNADGTGIMLDSGNQPLTPDITEIGPFETDSDSMSDDPKIEQIVALIRELVADARSDERRKTLDALMQGIQAEGVRSDDGFQRHVRSHPYIEKSTRAPAGSGRVLCKRVLAEVGTSGSTAKAIHEKRQGAYEGMLSLSAIRNELSVGAGLSPPIYKLVGGVWYLPEHAPVSMRIVS
jgi:hypothetical protein